MKPGQPERHDYEYERNGTASLFMMFAPREGWRHIEVTDRRTAIDYAHALEALPDPCFQDAKRIALVQDNSPRSGGIRSAPLNTRKPASLYEAFPPDKARRRVERFEWHYTPKHGSRLNMAESERAALASQCLGRRMADKQKLTAEIAAWEADRNKYHAQANWQFTTDDARIKLKRLYPTF